MIAVLKASALLFATVMFGIQFYGRAHTNPPIDRRLTLEDTVRVPPAVLKTFARACNDCHSHETNWRWYTYVAPISWLTVDDVNRGRAELNFSEWGSYGARMRETRLRAICQLSRTGTMPLRAYSLVHPAARLSSDEINAICEWTASQRPH